MSAADTSALVVVGMLVLSGLCLWQGSEDGRATVVGVVFFIVAFWAMVVTAVLSMSGAITP